MESLIPLIVGIIKDAPGYFVLTIGFVALALAFYIKVRAINIDEITSIGKLQSSQVAELINQVSQLSNDLAMARKEISSLYDKIDELEDIVRKYRNKLRDEDINFDGFPDTKSSESKA